MPARVPIIAVMLRSPLALALVAIGCGEGPTVDADPGSTTAVQDSTTTGVAEDPLPPRPDTITCRFEGTAPGLLPPLSVGAPLLAEGAVDLVSTTARTYVALADRRIVALGAGDPTPVLDLGTRAARLVALAVPADHDDSGALYVRFEDAASSTVISRFTIDVATGLADPASERVVLAIDDVAGDRSGGALAFGPDGMLYIGVGDAGSDGGQPSDPTSRLGKLLRIDPSTLDALGTYSTPADNPFVGSGGASDEVWARGLRDPWRCVFAPDDPSPWCVDVGASQQEIDHVERSADLGWPNLEGTACLLAGGDCGDLATALPVATYRAGDGDCGIAGVVLGGELGEPALDGALLYPDRCSGRIRGLDTESGEVLIQDEIVGVAPTPPTAIAQDGQGNAVLLSAAGVAPLELDADPATFPVLLSQSGCFADLATLAPTPGVVPYGVNAALWTDGAIKDRFIVLPPDTTLSVGDDGTLVFPPGSLILKLFSFEFTTDEPSSRRAVEARVMVLGEFGWQFHTYRFDEDGSDAELLVGGAVAPLVLDDHGASVSFEYTWPSRGNCKVCHGLGTSSALGTRLDQLAGDHDYGHTVADQLDALVGIGMFAEPPGPVEPMVAVDDVDAPVELRARAYLHTNCGHCHRPGGWTPADLTLDLRWDTALHDTNTCDVELQYFNPWATTEIRIAPGDADGSVLWQRLSRRGLGQMPPLATARVDPGAAVVREWIDGLDGCP